MSTMSEMSGFPESVKSFVLSTGNVMTLNEIKRRATRNAAEELASSLAYYLPKYQSCLQQQSKDTLMCKCSSENYKIVSNERKDLKLTGRSLFTIY